MVRNSLRRLVCLLDPEKILSMEKSQSSKRSFGVWAQACDEGRKRLARPRQSVETPLSRRQTVTQRGRLNGLASPTAKQPIPKRQDGAEIDIGVARINGMTQSVLIRRNKYLFKPAPIAEVHMAMAKVRY